ncbi:MAG: LysR family transcriptional regulator [Planctomycetota bacterium]|jgi:DNA-binding transcriptional LysR family regulator
MHIETFKIFCDLAELKSFSKTAQKNLLSQSAISQQLSQLELDYKCQLINRKKRPIELTKAGLLLQKTALEIIETYERFKSELNSLKTSTENSISVGAIFSIGMHALPDYVKKFMVKYPNVHVNIDYFSAETIYELVLEGDLDVGLVAIPKRDKRLDVYDFQDESLVLVCSPKHHLAENTNIDIHKLQFERFISFQKDVPTRLWIDSILQRYSIVVNSVMEFDNIETIKRAVEINSGISILPKTTILQELNSNTITAINFSNEDFTRPTGIIVRKDKILGQAGRFFIELLRRKTV